MMLGTINGSLKGKIEYKCWKNCQPSLYLFKKIPKTKNN